MNKIDTLIFDTLANSTYQSEYWCASRALVTPDSHKHISRAHWEELKGETVEEKLLDGLKKGYTLKMIPDEDEPAYVTYEHFKEVVRKNANSIEQEVLDSDSVMQIACFGEVVYG